MVENQKEDNKEKQSSVSMSTSAQIERSASLVESASSREVILAEVSALIQQNVAQPEYLIQLFRHLQRIKTSGQQVRVISEINRVVLNTPATQVKQEVRTPKHITQQTHFSMVSVPY